jgi:hypothetical protein
MKSVQLHPLSLLAGCALALVVTLGAGAAPASAPSEWEYRIVDDVEASDLAKLADEGWEFAGYLGQGVKGTGNDETLWKRAAK